MRDIVYTIFNDDHSWYNEKVFAYTFVYNGVILCSLAYPLTV